MDLTFGICGPGKVGCSLVKALGAAGLACTGVYGGAHAQMRAQKFGVPFCKDAAGLLKADVIFICVPDRFIAPAAQALAEAAGGRLKGKFCYHVSGSAGLDVLEVLLAAGAQTGSMHPLQSFAAVRTSFAGTGMAVDGTPEARELAEKLARLIGAAPFKVPPGERAAYHAAACFCSNFTVTVMALAEKLLARWTDSKEEAHRLLVPLLMGTAQNLAAAQSAGDALTGPVARGDITTVEAHLKALPREFLPVYAALARETVRVAAVSGSITQAAAAEMESLLTEVK